MAGEEDLTPEQTEKLLQFQVCGGQISSKREYISSSELVAQFGAARRLSLACVGSCSTMMFCRNFAIFRRIAKRHVTTRGAT